MSHFERLTVDLLTATLTSPFYIVLEIVPGSDHFGIWAVDDISFTSGCTAGDAKTVTNPNFTPFPLTTKVPSPCAGENFQCDQFKCIFRRQVCNFHTDCSDGTDEASCGADSFKSGWSDRSLGRLTWVVNNFTGEVRTSVRDGIGSDAYFQSAHFGGNGEACSVGFSYFVELPSESLQLNILYLSGKVTRQAVLFNSKESESLQYAKWNAAKVFLGRHEYGWQLQFVGRKDVVNNQTETIRLKNVRFSGCGWSKNSGISCDAQNAFTCQSGICIPKAQVSGIFFEVLN